MSSLHPVLGDIVEVFEFYDEPVLFVCTNAVGALFLVTLVEADAVKKTWLCAPMSRRRYDAVRRGAVDLASAFRDSEADAVFEITRNILGDHDCREVISKSLDESLLPVAGERLDAANILEPLPSVAALARAERNDVLRVRLSLTSGGIPASALLGSVFSKIQETINAIGQAVVEPSRRRGVSTSIAEQHELGVAHTFVGSFGIEFRPRATPDLFGDSPIVPTLEKFFSLLRSGHNRDAEQLIAIAKQLKSRPVVRFRDFLNGLLTGVSVFDANWGRPTERDERAVRLTSADANFCLETLSVNVADEPERFTVKARLVGLNARTKTYEIFDVVERRKFTGRVDNAVFAQVSNATINDFYLATIEETVIENLTGDVDSKFRLVGLVPNSG